jgi:hypothetical protein
MGDRMEWKLMTELLSIEDLPAGFQYPLSFVRVVGLGLTELELLGDFGGFLATKTHARFSGPFSDKSVGPIRDSTGQ